MFSWIVATLLATPPSLQQVPLVDPESQRPAVVVFLNLECPLVRLYTSRLNELHRQFGDRVHMVGVVCGSESATELDEFARQHSLTFPLVRDTDGTAERFGATRSPEVFLLDAQGVRYQGRIDDQYQPGIQRPQPTNSYLRDAIEAVLAGQAIRRPRTQPVGCVIGGTRSGKGSNTVTYAEHVAPILFRRCVSCHRPGQVGPFSLRTYQETAPRAPDIAEVVRSGQMPPWGADAAHGRFANDPSLTAQEKGVIQQWVDNGSPAGNLADMPPLPEFPRDGWLIKPDAIYTMTEPFVVPAEGVLEYQQFIVDPGLKEDAWIAAIQLRPGNSAVVHHATLRTKPRSVPGTTPMGIDGPLSDSQLAMYVPGQPVFQLPPGTAKRLPADRVFVLEVHYVAVGSPQTDQTQIGIVWADRQSVRDELATLVLMDNTVVLEPHLPEQTFIAEFTMPPRLMLHAMYPHMHLRGKSMRLEAVYPDGSTEVLLNVPRYDFSWQHRYILAEPKILPGGTIVRITAVFDNSSSNPRNPDADAVVRYGDQTTDEMMQAYLDLSLVDESPTRSRAWTVIGLGLGGILGLSLWRPLLRHRLERWVKGRPHEQP